MVDKRLARITSEEEVSSWENGGMASDAPSLSSSNGTGRNREESVFGFIGCELCSRDLRAFSDSLRRRVMWSGKGRETTQASREGLTGGPPRFSVGGGGEPQAA